jgi:CRP/FNR family transcriptional regulator
LSRRPVDRHAQSEGASFAVGITHQDLATRIGAVRELVSRNLARLQAQGFIAMDGRKFTVLDQSGLEAELASVI